MIGESDLRIARVTKWGIAGLLIFAGVMFIRAGWSDRMPLGDLAACLALAGLGFGLLLNWWVARWLALGLCFLLVGAAFVVPALKFLFQPPGTSSGAVFGNALFAVFFVVLGGIGFRGLGYYRSELGRREYAGNAEREQRMQSEKPAEMVVSAAVWVLFFILAQAEGMTLTKGMLTTHDANADLARPAVPPTVSAEQPVASDAEPPPTQAEDAGGPDIAPIGLCRGGEWLVVVAFENRGRGGHSDRFVIEHNNSVYDPRSRVAFSAKLPPPGAVEFGSLGFLGTLAGEDGMNNIIKVELDPDNRIRESDERNNTPGYPIDWDIFEKLPACDSLRTVER